MAHDVFISHSAKDKAVSDAVCAMLEGAGIRCWVAPRDILPSADWGESIIEAIEGARLMVVIFSSHSNQSEQVKREVQNAVQEGLAILPLRIEDVPLTKSLRYFLGSVHWLDALTPPLESHLTAMLPKVQTLLGLAVSQTTTAAPPAAPPPAERRPVPPPSAPAAAPPPAERRPVPSPGAPPARIGESRPPVEAPVPGGKRIQIRLSNGLLVDFVRIPPGTFWMGPAARGDGCRHEVTINKPFFMGVYPVTQEQYAAIMRENPSQFRGDRNPVENVCWRDAVAFCEKLSRKTGKTVRLPTEAEWEYACRAGSHTLFCFGNDQNLLDQYAWYRNNSDSSSHPVGLKRPNAFGLYDMHGNVHEWCSDWYDKEYHVQRDEYLAQMENPDPTGPPTGTCHVIRGGCWESIPLVCRSACRDWHLSDASVRVGFRPILANME